AFAEHQVMLRPLELNRKVIIVLVKTEEDLGKCDALVIAGGGEINNHGPSSPASPASLVLDPLKDFIKDKTVWGTCARVIMRPKTVVGARKGGEELLGGMSVTTARNRWGSQVGFRLDF
ncbi:hypothetical protein K435DRAFT_694579, partial [Dendrothele bispora CBS 962.96]